MTKRGRKVFVVGEPSTSFLITGFIQKLEQRVEAAKAVQVGKTVACPVCNKETVKATHDGIYCSTKCADVMKPL